MRLTKSKFTTALTCPTKLYYSSNKQYANQSIEDTFLAALAEGGFQVGELAKHYFPGGKTIETLDVAQALSETQRLLELENVTIFEAAIQFENCLVRVDVLEKVGNSIKIHEVKAKSFNSLEGNSFTKKNGLPNSEWKKYLYDVAFQKWVCMQALRPNIITAHLMLADKSKKTATAGLNQKFRIQEINGRKSVKLEGLLSENDLNPKILTSVNVDDICANIFSATDHGLDVEETFDEMISRFSRALEANELIETYVGVKCGQCEFICKEADTLLAKKDGRAECFKRTLNVPASTFNDPTVFDLWNYRGKHKFLHDGIIRLSDLDEEDIGVTEGADGLSNSERQWLQIQKAKERDDTVYIDRAGLSAEMSSWVYPLHFIDFETTMVAIPFGANRSPYEGIAFQFSHHTVDVHGTVKHAGEFLSVEPGVFPNYDFVRKLKIELTDDDGTIFRYSNHENTYLNIILRQLLEDNEPPSDRDELIAFIKSITKSPKKSDEVWIGERCMVDLLEVIKSYYFDPRTNGSNSIKYVLPAILSRSSFLQKKYSSYMYGAQGGIPSKNFSNWKWITFDDNNQVVDPYLLLPKLFEENEEEQVILLTQDNELKNGGAALMAYARMQFEAMSDYERDELTSALLKYCELDTLAMVMIYEAWKSELGS